MMDTNIEKEERAMLDELTFNKMVNDLAFAKKPITQTNYYFDTKDLSLLKNHIVVRIRKTNNQDYELTTKIKGTDGDEEINQALSEFEAKNYLETKRIEQFKIKDKEPINLIYIVELSTIRYEIQFNDYLLVLDKNNCANIEDYNIEIESNISKTHAKRILLEYKEKYSFSYQENYLSKSRRAINEYLKSN